MYNSDDAAITSRPTYNAAERHPWAGAVLAGMTLLAMGLVLTFLLGGALVMAYMTFFSDRLQLPLFHIETLRSPPTRCPDPP